MKLQRVNTLVFSSFGYSVDTLQFRILGSTESFRYYHFSLNKNGRVKVRKVVNYGLQL